VTVTVVSGSCVLGVSSDQRLVVRRLDRLELDEDLVHHYLRSDRALVSQVETERHRSFTQFLLEIRSLLKNG